MEKDISFKILIIFCICILSACNNKSSKQVKMNNQDFDTYQNQFIEQLWSYYPDWATNIGYHKNDSMMIIPNDEARNAQKEFAINSLNKLHLFEFKSLNNSQKIDYHLIENQLNKILWMIDEEKSYQWDPSQYNVSGLIAVMLSENYAPIEKRLHDIHLRMKKIPSYYEAAKQNIKNPVVILTDLAKNQNIGGLTTFEKDLKDSIQNSNLLPEKKQEILLEISNTVAAIQDYVKFLDTLSNPTPRDFRLGSDLYEKKFEFDIQSIYTAQQIYDSALARKSYLHEQMYKITTQLWPQYFGSKPIPDDKLKAIREMIDTLSVNHVTPAEYQDAIAAQLPQLIAFIKKKNLLYIDESKPLIVRREPAYMAGVSIASISAPGPYDKSGNTYYNVGNIENLTAELAESHLREYNHYIMQILNIHEAIPGHYTQLVYANQNPSLVKSIFANGAMIEGWAVYTEQMMLENGYGNNEPEMWLMWYKWHLRTVCNTILDYSVHVNGMTEDEALHLLMDEAFQQKAEALGKWTRVSVSSVQLMSYYTGYKEIHDLREQIKQKLGSQFDLKSFHEKFLSFGNAPVKYIKEEML
ncbi:MAG: DUF885 domain-containing protein [Bacteroidetes bacterium]|nr:DUF885 domain-containing protein [Bacteroidota bacterium]